VNFDLHRCVCAEIRSRNVDAEACCQDRLRDDNAEALDRVESGAGALRQTRSRGRDIRGR
jgi:hypothetical protein